MERFASLHSAEASLVLEHDPDRGWQWRHFGARVDPDGIPALGEQRGAATFALDEDIGLPVCPPSGLGWFGPPVAQIIGQDGHEILPAPSRFELADAPDRLSLSSIDDISQIQHDLDICIMQGGAFRLATSLTNRSSGPVTLTSLASAQIPLPASIRRIISWRGRHNAELLECSEAMPQHRWERTVRRGISGHGGPPGIYILDQEAGWHSGFTLALQLAWSGDNSIAIERDDEGFWWLHAQALLAPGECVLQPGETYHAPAAILAMSTQGRNGAMAQQHAAIRSMLNWPGGEMAPRPVHLNSWEACYFNHDAKRIRRLAKAAADIGVERFVLDDGWFQGRRNDRAGLGDWVPDPHNYPDGLAPLAREVATMGMEFGLWVEPEMINPDSDLYRKHPEWALRLPGREQPTARHQLVMDMRREDVRDHLFQRLSSVLANAPISYLKWDHNRDHAPSAGAAQTCGTYALFERIRAAHPDIEIEGCAGGGGRSDAGLATYVHRFWTSDNIDAVARIGMQRGFLAFLPPEMMGSHVGASPAHATGRTQNISFRAAIACMGHFGVELDPEGLTQSDRAKLSDWIAFYKQWRILLHGTRIDMGEGPDGLRWQAHGTNERKILFCTRSSLPQDRRPQPLPIAFAAHREAWNVTLLRVAEHREHGIARASLFDRMEKEPVRLTGSWLAHAGLPMPIQQAESVAIFLMETTP